MTLKTFNATQTIFISVYLQSTYGVMTLLRFLMSKTAMCVSPLFSTPSGILCALKCTYSLSLFAKVCLVLDGVLLLN